MRISLAFLTILILVAVFAPGVSALERTPPGSYLIYRATSMGELRSQVAKNKIVQARYASHFGIPAAQLDAKLLSGLTLTSLKQPLRVQSWYISKSGKTSVKMKLLPRGTMVFANKQGVPLLAWSCGNPLSVSAPITLVKALKESVGNQPVETKVLASPIETITTAVVTAPPAPALVSVLPIETPPILASIAASAVSMPPVIGSSNLGLGGLLAAAGGALAYRDTNKPDNPVPEPSSALAIGSLLGMIPMAWRKRRQKGA